MPGSRNSTNRRNTNQPQEDKKGSCKTILNKVLILLVLLSKTFIFIVLFLAWFGGLAHLAVQLPEELDITEGYADQSDLRVSEYDFVLDFNS